MARYEDRFRLAVENAVVGFLVEDPADGRILEANKAACELLGRDEQELLGLTWRDITHPEDRSQGADLLGVLMRGEQQSITMRKRYVTGNRGVVWCDVTLTCVRDADGRPRYNIAQVRDATAEVSLASINRVIADTPDGDQLCGILLRGLRAPFQATVHALYAVVPGENRVHLVGSSGWTAPESRTVSDIPLSMEVPVSDAVRTGSPAFMRIAHVPEVAPFACSWFERHPWRDTGDVAAFPLVSRGETIGVQYLEFSGRFDRTWQNVERFTALGQAIVPWMMVTRMSMESAGVAPPPVRGSMHVSDRQRTIVRLVRDGCTNREIADRLGYSEATVRADLSHLSRMLGAHGRREVAMKAERAGM